jgi:hypothetical protein
MLLRFRTAAIMCFVLIGGMWGLPALIWAIFLPSLKQGLPNPLPAYERILLDFAVFCEAQLVSFQPGQDFCGWQILPVTL